MHLNNTRVDSALAREGAAQTIHGDAYNLNVTQWLNEQEAKHKFIVYQTDADATPWSKRCLLHADKVLARRASPVSTQARRNWQLIKVLV
ncbi:MAG: hypothetical protein ABGX33_04440 [Cycloclasticus sp.]